MITLIELYETAYLNDIEVYNFEMNKAEATSIMDDDGNCYIALNPYKLKSVPDEMVKLAHDLGHCMTGSFYNRYSKLNNISQKEYRADRWAIQHLIPYYEFESALKNGYTEPWELAEYFSLPEEFVRRAIKYYKK